MQLTSISADAAQLLRMTQWRRAASSQVGLYIEHCDLGPRGECRAHLPIVGRTGCPAPPQDLTKRYLLSVTLRQHRLFFLFPFDLSDSRKGFSVLVLLAESALKSCSQQ